MTLRVARLLLALVASLSIATSSSSCVSRTTTAASGASTGQTPHLRVLGAGPRLLLAQLHLPAGSRFSLPTSACQAVIALVRRGAVELADGRAVLPGRAVRFGIGGAALANTGTRAADLYVAVSRSVARRFGPDATLDMQLAPDDPECQGGNPGEALSSPDSTGPFELAGGEARASIHIDAAHQGATHASLVTLEGSETARVPVHQHEESAEIVFVESGEGRMRLGDQNISIHAGTFVYVPPGTEHSFTPSGNEPLRAVQLYAPPGPEQRFRPQPMDVEQDAGAAASNDTREDAMWNAGGDARGEPQGAEAGGDLAPVDAGGED